MTIVTNWDLTDEQVAALDAIVSKFNLEAKAAYDARVLAAIDEEMSDLGPTPTPETRESFVTRLGYKSLRGEIEVRSAALRSKNIDVTIAAFNRASDTTKATVMDALGLSVIDGVASPKR